VGNRKQRTDYSDLKALRLHILAKFWLSDGHLYIQYNHSRISYCHLIKIIVNFIIKPLKVSEAVA